MKPDVHVLGFVHRAIGRKPMPEEAVQALVSIASTLGRECYELDAAIWHHMHG